MAEGRESVYRCIVLSGLILGISEGATGSLQAYGCDEGWSDFGDYCYSVGVKDVIADKAKVTCSSLGASLASVWKPEEKDFILSIWQFPKNELGFLWIGLRGKGFGEWEYDDGSQVNVTQGDTKKKWSILDGVVGMPASTSNKCVALRNSGTLAFLDCNMDANAFVCKKSLPKVYVTASLLNHTGPQAASPMGHVQLFERMFPPVLTSLPDDSSQLAEASVATEVGCAFRCFSVSGCQVFQVSCMSSKNCDLFRCVLFPDFVL